MREVNTQPDMSHEMAERPPLHIHFERLLDPKDELHRTASSRELLVTAGFGPMPSYVKSYLGVEKQLVLRSVNLNSTTEVQLLDVLEFDGVDVYQVNIWHQYPKKTVNLLVVHHEEEHVELWSAGGLFCQRVAVVDENPYI